MSHNSDQSSIPSAPRSARRAGARKILLIALAALVLVVVAAIVAAPAIASRMAPPIIESRLKKATGADVTLSGVSLSWGGPLRINDLVIKTPDGSLDATVSAEISKGLASLALNSSDLGDISLRGSADVTVRPRPITVASDATPAKPKNAPTSSPTGKGQFALGRSLIVNAKLTDFDLKVTRLDESGSATIVHEWNDITGSASIDPSGSVDMALDARASGASSDHLAISVDAPDLVNSRGEVDIASAQIDTSADVQFSDSILTTLLTAFASPDAIVTGDNSDVGSFTAKLDLKASNGRLTVADPAHPPFVQGRIPKQAIRIVHEALPELSITSAPGFRLAIESLDVPIDWSAGASALEAGAARITGSLDPIETTIDDPSSGAPQSLTLDNTSLLLSKVTGESEYVFELNSECRTSQPQPGSLHIGCTLDPSAIDAKSALPFLRAATLNVVLTNVDTTLLQPFARAAGVDAIRGIGPTIELEAIVEPSDANSGEIALDLTLAAAKAHAQASLTFDPSVGIRGGEDSLYAEGHAIRHLIPTDILARAPQLSGDGIAILKVDNINIPFVEQQPDFSKASAVIRADIGSMQYTLPEGGGTIQIQSLDHEIDLVPGEPIMIALEYKLSEGERLTGAKGMLAIKGLALPRDLRDTLSIDFSKVQPEGSIEVLDFPADLVGAFSNDAAAWIDSAFGPRISGTIQARPVESGKNSGALSLRAQHATASATFELEAGVVQLTGDGLHANFESPSLIFQRAIETAKAQQQLQITGSGPLTVNAPSLRIVLPKSGERFTIANVKGTVSATLQSLRASVGTPESANVGSSFTFDSIVAALNLESSEAVKIRLTGTGSSDSGPINLDADLTAHDVQKSAQSIPDISGTIEVSGLPTALAAFAGADAGALAPELIGPLLTLSAEADRSGAETEIQATLQASALNARTEITRRANNVRVKSLSGTANIQPRAVEIAINRFANSESALPSLQSPTTIEFAVDPIELDLTASPVIPANKPLRMTLSAKSDVIIGGVSIGDPEAPKSIGLRSMHGTATLAGPAINADLQADLFDPGQRGAALGGVSIVLQRSPELIAATVDMTEGQSRSIDTWLGREGALELSIGGPINARVEYAQSSTGEMHPLRAKVDAPRLQTDLRLVPRQDRLALAEPVRINWTLDPRWANSYLMPADETGQRLIELQDPASISMSLNSLTLGPLSNPLEAGKFSVDLAADASSISLIDQKQRSIVLHKPHLSANSTSTDQVNFNLRTAQSASDPNGFIASGSISNLSSASLESPPAINLQAKGNIPTVLIDALAKMNGTAVDILGSTTSVDIAATEFSRNSGTMRAAVKTDYSAGALSARAENGSLIATQPASIQLDQITSDTSRRLFESIFPLLDEFHKTTDDRPSIITAEQLTIPLDGDTRKLNGTLRVDLGTVQFKAAPFFASILESTKNRSFGKLGQTIEPFTMNITNGVIRYDVVKIPTGDYILETQGKVNLNRREVDLVVFLPVFAVDESISKAAGGLPGLDRLTMIPLRFNGPMDKPEMTIDPEKLFERAPETIGGTIEGILGGLLSGEEEDEADKDKKNSGGNKKKKKNEKKQSSKPQ